MRISCNGCRVLRKGCSEDCSLRPCLIWLESPESQANATAFLAKFYGRAGLINLISAAPSHLRPEIFRSLLYEACGRIINPVYGSVGLMSSGDWARCHAAVEAVLSGGGGQLLNRAAGDDDSSLPGCDIRHISKGSAVSPHRVTTRRRRKRSASRDDSVASAEYLTESDAKFTITGWDDCGGDRKDFVVMDHESTRAPSHDSFSVETVEPSLTQFDERAEPEPRLSELRLELSLGLNPVLHSYLSTVVQISDGEY